MIKSIKRLLLIGVCCVGLVGCANNVGEPIPSFKLTTLNGEEISSENLKGKATVMVVWATWCGDCIREIPELNQLAEKYGSNDNVKLLAFSDEDEATVKRFLSRLSFNFTHIVDAKAYTDQLYTGAVKQFPQILVLNSDLEVVFDITENKKPVFDEIDQHIRTIIEN